MYERPIQPGPREVKDFHRKDDVDSASKAHHHTLGYGLFQAAPGHITKELIDALEATKLNRRRISNTLTASPYTFVIDDEQKYVQVNMAGAMTMTVPPESSVPWANNTEFFVVRLGVGTVTVQPGVGVTFDSVPGAANITLGPRYSEAKFRRRAADRWIVTGGIV